MICRIRAGSLTTDSLSAIGLCLAMADSVSGSVTVQPWSRKSPVSSSMNTAGQWSPPVSGSMPMKRSAMRYPLLVALRAFAPFQGHPDDLGQSTPGTGLPATGYGIATPPGYIRAQSCPAYRAPPCSCSIHSAPVAHFARS